MYNIVYDTVRKYGFEYRKFELMHRHLGKIRSAETGKERQNIVYDTLRMYGFVYKKCVFYV